MSERPPVLDPDVPTDEPELYLQAGRKTVSSAGKEKL
jgi:hypothetical protein